MAKPQTLSALKKAKALEEEAKLRKACEALAVEKFSKEQLAKWGNANQGLWFLPIRDENDKIIALGIFKKITRTVLSYAMSKMEEEGMMEFLEAAMRDCWIAGDECILDDDDYFIPASQHFQKMMNGYKAAMVKR